MYSPVQNYLKFSAVFGVTELKSSILILPTFLPAIATSRNTTSCPRFKASFKVYSLNSSRTPEEVDDDALAVVDDAVAAINETQTVIASSLV